MTVASRIIQAIQMFGPGTPKSIAEAADTNRNTTRRVLAELLMSGKLTRDTFYGPTLYRLAQRIYRYQFDFNITVFPRKNDDEEGYAGDARIAAVITEDTPNPRNVFAYSLLQFLREELPWAAKLTEWNESREEIPSLALSQIPQWPKEQKAFYYAEVSFASGFRYWKDPARFTRPSLYSLTEAFIVDVLRRIKRGAEAWIE